MTVAAGSMLEVSRFIAAQPERVFDAWFGSEWCSWLGPAGSTCRLVSANPKVGGAFALAMTTPDGQPVEVTGEYRRIDRPSYLELMWIDDLHEEEWTITVDFQRRDTGTMLTLRQSPFAFETVRQSFVSGWADAGASFDKLEDLLKASG